MVVRDGSSSCWIWALCLYSRCICVSCSPPQIVWAFWHDHTNLPRSIQLARASWTAFAPEYTIHFLDQHTWRNHLDAGEVSRCGTGRTFAEWLRLRLLCQHGGVWLDASIVLTAPLDFLVSKTANVSGVDIKDGMNFETSFIAAVPRSETITLWLQEYVKICDMNEEDYNLWLVKFKADGIELLNGQYADCDWGRKSLMHGALESLLQFGSAFANLFVRYTKVYVHPCGQAFWISYLKINTSLNAVLGMTGRNPKQLWDMHGIYTQPTEKTLMLVPHLQGYDDNRVAVFLRGAESNSIDMHAMRGVKLSKGDREMLDSFSTCQEGSIICRVQQLTKTEIFQRVPASETEIEHNKEL